MSKTFEEWLGNMSGLSELLSKRDINFMKMVFDDKQREIERLKKRIELYELVDRSLEDELLDRIADYSTSVEPTEKECLNPKPSTLNTNPIEVSNNNFEKY